MEKRKFYTRFNPPTSTGIKFVGESRTRKEFLQESDINRLVKRYQETGSFYDPVTSLKGAKNKPFFGDFTNIPDYQEALNIVIDAQDRFASLPSSLRDRFNNDPQALIDFVMDDKNREEAIKIGLIPEPEKPEPEKPE